MSGTDVEGGTGYSMGRLIPFFPTERLPLVPLQLLRVTLGPTETSFSRLGRSVVVRSRARFQLGALFTQPPGSCNCPMQFRFHVSMGEVDCSALLSHRPKKRFFSLIW